MKSTFRFVCAFGVILFMSIPCWAEVINVCVNTGNGNMRYVEEPSECRSNENLLLMNTEGPAGSDGTDGINCWDLNGNGVCDLASEDSNSDGDCNAADCRGAPGTAGGFDVSKLYVVTCNNEYQCQCEDRGGRHFISGAVNCDMCENATQASLSTTTYLESLETFEATRGLFVLNINILISFIIANIVSKIAY